MKKKYIIFQNKSTPIGNTNLVLKIDIVTDKVEKKQSFWCNS